LRKLLLGGVAIAAISIAAGPVQTAPPAVYNWTGCYIGGNIGGGWAHKEFDPNATIGFPGATAKPSSFVGGGQIGCDYQNGMWIVGAQGLFDWASMHAQSPFFSGKGFSARVPWFATVTGRLGYLVQPTMVVFVRGGAAFVRDEYQFFHGGGSAPANETRSGWTVSGGAEWMFAPSWSLAIEYGYMGFGTNSVNFNALGLATENVNQHVQVVLVGLNYRFNSGAPR
jgi:outer membrane immunogenic protein